jgi:hypothetical protein
MRLVWVGLVSAMLACSDRLPELPSDSNDAVPTSIELLVPLRAVDAGDYIDLEVVVLDQRGRAMEGQTLTAKVDVASGVEPYITFPLGNTCTATRAGCLIKARSEGHSGTFEVSLSSGAARRLVVPISVRADLDRAVVEIEPPGRSVMRWVRLPTGEDPLEGIDPVRVVDNLEATRVVVRLLDWFGNDATAELDVRVSSEQIADDLGADAGVVDNHPVSIAIVAADEECADVRYADAQTIIVSGEVGLCLQVAERFGDAQVTVRVDGVTDGHVRRSGDSLTDALVLPVFATTADALTLVAEGSDLRLTCPAGEDSTHLIVRAYDGENRPVPRLLLRTESVGLAGVEPAAEQRTAVDGSAEFWVRCPGRRIEDSSLTVRIAGDEVSAPVVVPVEVQTGQAARINAFFENENERNRNRLLMGESRTLVLEVLDVFGNALPNTDVAISLPGDACDKLRFSRNAPVCGARSNDPINPICGGAGEQRSGAARHCQTNSQGKVYLPLRASGKALLSPLPLTVSAENALGDDPVIARPLQFLPGPADRITFSPDSVRMFRGAPERDVNIWVQDKEGNPKSGVEITLSEAPDGLSLSLVDGFGNTVFTGQDGVARIRVGVQQEGTFELSATARLSRGREGESFLFVHTAEDDADRLVLSRDGVDLQTTEYLWHPRPNWLPPGLIVDGDAFFLEGRVGDHWPSGLELSVRNLGGGIIQEEHGVAVEWLAGSGQCDALSPLRNARTVVDTGLLDLSALGLRFGEGVGVCTYRLSASGVNRTLYLVQHPGRPAGGVWQVNLGTEEGPNWQALGENARVARRDGFTEQPLVIPFDAGHDLRMANPQDAFGNRIPIGTRMAPALSNAYSIPEAPILRADIGGSMLSLRVAGGRAFGQRAIIRPGSFEGWDNPPEVWFPTAQGRPRLRFVSYTGVDRKAFGAVAAGRVFVAASGGNAVAVDPFADRDLLYQNENAPALNEDPADQLAEGLSDERQHHAQFLDLSLWGATGAVFRPILPSGFCNEEAEDAHCSRVRIEHVHDGRMPIHPPHRVGVYSMRETVGTAPDTEQPEPYYRALVPIADLRHGGLFSVSIESDPLAVGDDLLVSDTQPLYAVPRAELRARGVEILPPTDDDDESDEAAAVEQRIEGHREAGTLPHNWRNRSRILQVSSVQLDQDPAQELLACGDDAFGGWVALIDPNTERAAVGTSPFGEHSVQAVRTYFSPGLRGDDVEWVDADRDTVGSDSGPGVCGFVRDGPGGRGYVVSRGVPASEHRPVSRVIFTPWLEGTRLGSPQSHNLDGPPEFSNPKFLFWEGEGLVAHIADRCYRFPTTAAGGLRVLRAETMPACPDEPIYGGFELDVDGDNLSEYCVGGACSSSSACLPGAECGACSGNDDLCVVGRETWRGGAVEVLRIPGTMVAKVGWGGREGLVAFTRHSSRLSWYDFRRSDITCGLNGCPPPVCGNEVLERDEACEIGPGCTENCQLSGLRPGDLATGLSLSFAAAQWEENGVVRGETQPFALTPLPMNVNRKTGLYVSGSPASIGPGSLSYYGWLSSRPSCRRLGGDLVTESQWDRAMRAGGGLAARIYPWGDTDPVTATRLSGTNGRVGSAWLGATPEGLIGVGDDYDQFYVGHLVRDALVDALPGVDGQAGPFNNLRGESWTRYRIDTETGALAGRHYSYAESGQRKMVRCVWRHNAP